MVSKAHSQQISGGVFLIGLALVFMTGYWFPGILFVIGASTIARGMAEGQEWYNVQGGVWMIGLGLVFAIGFSLPLLLILVGASMLLGYGQKQLGWSSEDDRYDDEKPKRKNEVLV